jgi:palmitoyltransferase
MPRAEKKFDPNNAFLYDAQRGHLTEMEAFRLRQLEDLKRFNQNDNTVRKRQVFHKRYDPASTVDDLEEHDAHVGADEDGEEAWRNSEGERLADFGVDEEVEFYDEEDLPLAELMRRKQGLQSASVR